MRASYFRAVKFEFYARALRPRFRSFGRENNPRPRPRKLVGPVLVLLSANDLLLLFTVNKNQMYNYSRTLINEKFMQPYSVFAY